MATHTVEFRQYYCEGQHSNGPPDMSGWDAARVAAFIAEDHLAKKRWQSSVQEERVDGLMDARGGRCVEMMFLKPRCGVCGGAVRRLVLVREELVVGESETI